MVARPGTDLKLKTEGLMAKGLALRPLHCRFGLQTSQLGCRFPERYAGA